MTPRASQIKI